MSERIVDGIYTINLGVKRYRDSKPETVAETGSTPLRCRSFFKNNSRTSGKIISSVRDNSSLYSTQIFIDGSFRVDLTFYLWNLFIELI